VNLSIQPCPLVGLVHNYTHLRHLANSQALFTVPIPTESCVVWSLSETRDISQALTPFQQTTSLTKSCRCCWTGRQPRSISFPTLVHCKNARMTTYVNQSFASNLSPAISPSYSCHRMVDLLRSACHHLPSPPPI
jgi:hypothetical protein